MNNLSALARVFVWTVVANFLVMIVGIAAYPEPFSLVMDPMSWLGKQETAAGLVNTRVSLLSSVTLIMDAVLWCYAIFLLSNTRFSRRPEIRVLSRMVPLGFIIMAFPCDRFILTHSIGAALMVGGLWAFTTTGLHYLKTCGVLNTGVYLGLQCLLQVTAVYCGINFAWDTPLKGFSQRPLFMAIMIDIAICLYTLAEHRQGKFVLKTRC